MSALTASPTNDDHNSDWRNLADDEETALRLACRDVLFSNYANAELSVDFVLHTAFDLLINGYEECAA